MSVNIPRGGRITRPVTSCISWSNQMSVLAQQPAFLPVVSTPHTSNGAAGSFKVGSAAPMGEGPDDVNSQLS